MSLKLLREAIRGILSEEIGRNFQTIHTEPISYKDFANYDVDIITTVDGKYILSILYNNEKLSHSRSYPTREEAELAARKTVESHRLANVD